MALMIRSLECNGCALCMDACPMAAVAPKPEFPLVLQITPQLCTECVGSYQRPRCMEVCTHGCIQTDPSHLEDRRMLMSKWRSRWEATV